MTVAEHATPYVLVLTQHQLFKRSSPVQGQEIIVHAHLPALCELSYFLHQVLPLLFRM